MARISSHRHPFPDFGLTHLGSEAGESVCEARLTMVQEDTPQTCPMVCRYTPPGGEEGGLKDEL